MADKHPWLLLPLLFLLAALPAVAQEAAPEAAGQASVVSSYYNLDAKGQVVFTQVLSWDADPNTLRSEVTIRNSEGTDILHKFTEESKVDIRLPPGSYTYNLVTWNLLNQPEMESGWQPLVVIKAEIPVLKGTSPLFIYMDSLDGKVSFKGEKLIEGARFYLQDSSGRQTEGRVVQREGEKSVVVVFPDRAYQLGTFDLVVVNPGGLKASVEKALRILYQRPVDIFMSLGYTPSLFFQDQFFKENWPDTVYWKGANAALSVYFIKKNWGFLGLEAEASVFSIDGGTSQASVTSDYLLMGMNLVYKYRFNRVFHGIARAGAGLSSNDLSFDYQGTAGPSTTSSDPYCTAGLMGQYFLPHKLTLELGADWVSIFQNGYTVGGLRPTVRVGYQLF